MSGAVVVGAEPTPTAEDDAIAFVRLGFNRFCFPSSKLRSNRPTREESSDTSLACLRGMGQWGAHAS